jgi:AcrR family transcriptional regulator
MDSRPSSEHVHFERGSKMNDPKTPKGEATAEHILQAALSLFRERGFSQTTMRDVASAAGKSLGAAYHYFPSKESIVAAYYRWTQDEHERRLGDGLRGTVAERFTRVMSAKLDIIAGDRKLLAAQFASLADPSDPLSLFGPDNQALRARSVAVFEQVFADVAFAAEIRKLAAYIAWLLHLGVLLFFIHDDSPQQVRTRVLNAAAGELFGFAVPFASTPFAAPMLERGLTLARSLGVPGV